MPTAPKTARALDEATLDLAEKSEHRRHLGASVIGGKCERESFYKFRWAFVGNPHPPQRMRLFWRGHREEPELIRLLRRAGVTVYAAGESGELKAQLRITDCEGHFGGTPDGVGEAIPDLPADMFALLEFKTFNDDQFQKLKADRVQTAKWEYFVQMQLYMRKHELPYALFIAVNKNDDEIYYELVEANPVIADSYLSKARTIIYAQTPPKRIADSIARWPCRNCDFKHLCHTADFPAVNCRTCAYGRPVDTGPDKEGNGVWECSRGCPEIAHQGGCSEHLYNPEWFDDWQVLDYSVEENWMKIFNGVEMFVHGNQPNTGQYTSLWLLKNGLAPF